MRKLACVVSSCLVVMGCTINSEKTETGSTAAPIVPAACVDGLSGEWTIVDQKVMVSPVGSGCDTGTKPTYSGPLSIDAKAGTWIETNTDGSKSSLAMQANDACRVTASYSQTQDGIVADGVRVLEPDSGGLSGFTSLTLFRDGSQMCSLVMRTTAVRR